MKALLLAGCALIVVSAAITAVRAGAPPAIMAASPQYVTFGMVGLGTGQTARLNAFALPVGGPIIAGASCQVTFAFYDASGKTLRTSTATVAQGAAVHFDMLRTDIDGLTGLSEIRGTVRAAWVSSSPVLTPGTPGTPGTPASAFCSILPTLEVFDSLSGQTTVVLQQTTALPLVTPL
jgi:hypothetical protein